jgi:hypothetical protein
MPTQWFQEHFVLLMAEELAEETQRKCSMMQQAEAAQLDAAQASAARRLAIQLGCGGGGGVLWQPLRLILRDRLLPTQAGARHRRMFTALAVARQAATGAAIGVAAAAWRLMPLHRGRIVRLHPHAGGSTYLIKLG